VFRQLKTLTELDVPMSYEANELVGIAQTPIAKRVHHLRTPNLTVSRAHVESLRQFTQLRSFEPMEVKTSTIDFLEFMPHLTVLNLSLSKPIPCETLMRTISQLAHLTRLHLAIQPDRITPSVSYSFPASLTSCELSLAFELDPNVSRDQRPNPHQAYFLAALATCIQITDLDLRLHIDHSTAVDDHKEPMSLAFLSCMDRLADLSIDLQEGDHLAAPSSDQITLIGHLPSLTSLAVNDVSPWTAEWLELLSRTPAANTLAEDIHCPYSTVTDDVAAILHRFQRLRSLAGVEMRSRSWIWLAAMPSMPSFNCRFDPATTLPKAVIVIRQMTRLTSLMLPYEFTFIEQHLVRILGPLTQLSFLSVNAAGLDWIVDLTHLVDTLRTLRLCGQQAAFTPGHLEPLKLLRSLRELELDRCCAKLPIDTLKQFCRVPSVWMPKLRIVRYQPVSLDWWDT
jgi:hypothetical protein